jgi:predicted nucleic acid-binding protein
MEMLSAIIKQTAHISVIVQIEVLRFNDIPDNEKTLSDFISSCIIHPLTGAVAQRTIEICKQSNIKLPDAVIAATALIENCTLVTRNTNDFKNIPGLPLLNPWVI